MQNTAYDVRISDWRSVVCSSDLLTNSTLPFFALPSDVSCPATGTDSPLPPVTIRSAAIPNSLVKAAFTEAARSWDSFRLSSSEPSASVRSEEHTSELQSLMRISYAVFCLKKKKTTKPTTKTHSQCKHQNYTKNTIAPYIL